jgi:Fuc2NAc and GlcNAc transferase
LIYIVLFLISFALTYIIKQYAIKKSFVAEVNERSSHSIPTPHGGGIALAVAWFVGLVYVYLFGEIDTRLFYALLFGAIISVVSLFDDLYDLSAKLRLSVQAIVAMGGLYAVGGLGSIDFGLFGIENQIITNFFAFFMIIWFINLYNFLDGINGYAGSEAVFLGVAGFLLFGGEHFLVLVASVLGFLYWNWGNAKIFMGDVGSTLLGYNIAIFTVYYTSENPLNIWVWIIIFGLFWFDATLTLLRRVSNGEKLSEAHKKHAYQRLTQVGWSHTKVVIYSLIINFSLLYFILLGVNIFMLFFIMIGVLFSINIFVDHKKGFN